MTPRDVLNLRSQRALIFPHMEEPAWLILVDLLDKHGCNISVTSACLASFVPATTALRHIEDLETAGLIRREADPMDGRRWFLRLTAEAFDCLRMFFHFPVALPSVATGVGAADALCVAAPACSLSFHEAHNG